MTEIPRKKHSIVRKVAEDGLFVLGVIASPPSLLGQAFEVPFIRDGIASGVDRVTLTNKRKREVARALAGTYYGGFGQTRGLPDTIAALSAIKDAVGQARRDIGSEVETSVSQSYSVATKDVSDANNEIFRHIKRTFGYSLGMTADLLTGAKFDAVLGLPIPGFSGLRDELFTHIPQLDSLAPLFFYAGAGIAALGLIAGAINVGQNLRFARGVNKSLIAQI